MEIPLSRRTWYEAQLHGQSYMWSATNILYSCPIYIYYALHLKILWMYAWHAQLQLLDSKLKKFATSAPLSTYHASCLSRFGMQVKGENTWFALDSHSTRLRLALSSLCPSVTWQVSRFVFHRSSLPRPSPPVSLVEHKIDRMKMTLTRKEGYNVVFKRFNDLLGQPIHPSEIWYRWAATVLGDCAIQYSATSGRWSISITAPTPNERPLRSNTKTNLGQRSDSTNDGW